MWTRECRGGDVNEVNRVTKPLVFSNYVAPNNSNDSDCTSTMINPASIFKHLLPAENISKVMSGGSARAGQGGGGSTRWSPTPEQLMALEELYKHGTRTPTALQIQEITTKLRRFGKIEGKNVFYWFQNHKARDKKKQRLRLEASHRRQLLHHQHHSLHKTTTTPNSLLQYDHSSSLIPKVTTLHVQQTKREPLSNCSTISEEPGTVRSRVVEERLEDVVDKTVMKMAFRFPMPFQLINTEDNHLDQTKTLDLFPLETGNLKGSLLNATSSTQHTDMPFGGDLSLTLLL